MHTTFLLTACLVMIAVGPPRTNQDPSNTDSALLQGTWELHDQNSRPGANAAKRTLEVKGTTFLFRADEKITRQVTATLQATNKPKAIDLKEDGEEKPFLAIYELDKDRLTLCIAVEDVRPTNTRPAAFEAKRDQVLTTYVRVKR